MNTRCFARCVLGLAGLAWAAVTSAQSGIGTSFTFQGELRDGGGPGQGSYDFRARLFAPGGGAALAESVFEDVAVSEGRFMLPLDFTELPFREYGDLLGVELASRSGDSNGDWTVISPFIRLEPAPYALATRTVMAGSVGATEIDPQQVQRRVAGSCPGNSAISAIAADGSVTCDADDAGVTLQVGFGLIGGGNDGVVPLAIDPVGVQRRVNGVCAAGSSIRAIREDGSVDCEFDDGSGTIVTITDTREYVAAVGSSREGGAFAGCPASTQAIGGGFESNCPGVQIFRNGPNSNATSWNVLVFKDGTLACPNGILRVTAFARCAPR